ncbi:AraC family transcriptional regulator [Chryseobacterium sp. T16E-39]|uniref:helix-turn-helix domain-containing protein n=1 Tax=Chryseobacterium sp. T16E-39 TaxID=2015076 RepID=UPI000B5B178B|nr:AraC family transcriptional regulator [Chryseobacterium sp. T16E-39]ASK29637.1 AraC family transcriptional regulator [Chryseobacterium sp. T16E-39]
MMGREGIDIFSVQKKEIDTTLSISSRQSFTMVFVKEGKGIVKVDHHQYDFRTGKFFLLNTSANYHFYAEKASLIIIQCPLHFIDQIRTEADRIETCENLNKLNYIVNNYHSHAGCIFRNTEDLQFAEVLIENILREYIVLSNKDYLIIRQSISILLNLVARNLILSDTEELNENSTEFLIMKVITYVQQYIKDPEKTKVSFVAQRFGLSKTYFGEFFKKNVGVSYQSYLLAYRLKLVDTRLQFSTMRLKEIAEELGFNDESHLSKTFKKHRGISPSQYRNR